MGIKEIYGTYLSIISAVFGIDNAKKFDTWFRFKKSLNLKNPKTLSDKVTYIELHEQSPLAAICTDKYAVRDYIKSKGLEDILVPLIGGPWATPTEVPFDSFPDSFVVKGTHGCKMNYIVDDKSKFDKNKCIKEMERWLATTYGGYSIEPHYLEIPHRLYAEEFLKDADQLIDYKFHCLNGVPQFVLVCSDRVADGDKAMKVTLDLFDMEWQHIPEIKSKGLETAGNGNIEKPKHFNRMIEIASKLSENFKFVRVDLYEMNGRIYFGELTFSPACCVFPYFSEEFDKEMGNLLKL